MVSINNIEPWKRHTIRIKFFGIRNTFSFSQAMRPTSPWLDEAKESAGDAVKTAVAYFNSDHAEFSHSLNGDPDNGLNGVKSLEDLRSWHTIDNQILYGQRLANSRQLFTGS